MNTQTVETTARFLGIPADSIDLKLHREAVRAVQHKDRTYYDAMANVGQAPGNVPEPRSLCLL